MALFGKRQVNAQVTSLAWSREVQLERQQWEAKRSPVHPWAGETRNVKQHTEQFWATVTDMTPGTPDASGMPGPPTPTTRQELQTRVYYTYEQLEWRKWHTLSSAGADPSAVTWPEHALAPGERVRSRKESYQATFAAGDKQYDAELPEQEWRILEPGGSYILTLGLFGGVKKVIPAPP